MLNICKNLYFSQWFYQNSYICIRNYFNNHTYTICSPSKNRERSLAHHTIINLPYNSSTNHEPNTL